MHIWKTTYLQLYKYISVSFLNIFSLCIHKIKIPVSSEFTESIQNLIGTYHLKHFFIHKKTYNKRKTDLHHFLCPELLHLTNASCTCSQDAWGHSFGVHIFTNLNIIITVNLIKKDFFSLFKENCPQILQIIGADQDWCLQ